MRLGGLAGVYALFLLLALSLSPSPVEGTARGLSFPVLKIWQYRCASHCSVSGCMG